jgi:hypothetical protein
MTFTKDFSIVLSPFVAKYKTANNDKERKAVVRNAVEAVTKSANLREDGTVNLPKELPTVCLLFILSHFIDLY